MDIYGRKKEGMNWLWHIMVSAGDYDEGERVLDFCNVNHEHIFQNRPGHKYTCYGWNNEKQKYDRQTQTDLFLTRNNCFVTYNKANNYYISFLRLRPQTSGYECKINVYNIKTSRKEKYGSSTRT